MSNPIVISWECHCHDRCLVAYRVEIRKTHVTLIQIDRTDDDLTHTWHVSIEPAKSLLAGREGDGFIPTVQNDGSLSIGCQTIPAEIVAKVWEAIKETELWPDQKSPVPA